MIPTPTTAPSCRVTPDGLYRVCVESSANTRGLLLALVGVLLLALAFALWIASRRPDEDDDGRLG